MPCARRTISHELSSISAPLRNEALAKDSAITACRQITAQCQLFGCSETFSLEMAKKSKPACTEWWGRSSYKRDACQHS